MIKRLRIKFVCVVMSVVMLMLCGILSVVIYFTGVVMETQSISMMQTIAANPFQLENLGKGSGEVRLPFFIVKIGAWGEVIAASGGYFDLSDREFIQEIVNEVFSTDAEVGELEEYNLRYLKSSTVTGQTIIFSDTSTEQATLQNMLYICIGIFAAASLVFFGITILISQWAIKPVANAWIRQRQFVADASHELKTPLSVILANAELLQGDGYSETERKNFSQSILTMTYQMRTLVENLLEMARLDSGTAKMKFAPVDFSQLVNDAVLSFQLLYEEKGMGLCCDIPEGIQLPGSEQHLYQCKCYSNN